VANPFPFLRQSSLSGETWMAEQMKHSLKGSIDDGTSAAPDNRPAPLTNQQLARLVWPLVSFVVPTVVIGYGFVIPRSCIAGVNELSIGFGTTVVAACVTYVLGVRSARKL
jgi:hypothetical protein